MMKNWILISLIVIITALPYVIWRNLVMFSPEIFLTEWYKTIFITGLFGLFYKFVLEKKIIATMKTNKTNVLIDSIYDKIDQIENELNNNPKLTLQAIEIVNLLVETSQYKNELSTFINSFKGLTEKIQKYYETEDDLRKNEMRRNIKFSLKEIKNILK